MTVQKRNDSLRLSGILRAEGRFVGERKDSSNPAKNSTRLDEGAIGKKLSVFTGRSRLEC